MLSFLTSDGTPPQDAVVVIKDPRLEGDDLTYSIDLLEGEIPAKADTCALFIDPFGPPLSPASAAGMNRRARRRRRRCCCCWGSGRKTRTPDMTEAKIAHPGVEGRKALGARARKQTKPSSHPGWTPASDRPDPVALLEAQNVTRDQDLVPVRHGRMMVSPFTFYRGAAKIMADDLAATPTAGLTVQPCGDSHLSNFGLFASPERALLFDLNDFDETLPGPFEYDVAAYRESMAGFAEMGGDGCLVRPAV